MKEWYTEQEAAEWMGVTPEELKQAIDRGELPVLRIGGQVRLSRTNLIALAGGATVAPSNGVNAGPGSPADVADGRLASPSGLVWLDRLSPTQPFEHRWPATAKGPGTGFWPENYAEAWSGRIQLGGNDMIAKVGRSTGAERNDGKPRMTIFFDNYPMAEFMPTADASGWASVIKTDGRHTVPNGGSLPSIYRNASTAPYQSATGMSGPGRPTGLALVIGHEDLDSAVHHAAARWLGRQGRTY